MDGIYMKKELLKYLPDKEDDVSLSIRIPTKEYERICELSVSLGESRNKIIIAILKRFFDKRD